jgi:hypothetical protein
MEVKHYNENIHLWAMLMLDIRVDPKLWRKLKPAEHLPTGWRARRSRNRVTLRCHTLACMGLMTPEKADNFYATLVLIKQKEI